MTRALTWLHISDIHFFPKKEWRDGVQRASLLKYLSAGLKNGEFSPPDLIFCTGDIAFGGSTSMPISQQYVQAEQFFESLLIACGSNGEAFPKDRLFVVPGNHDVDRSRIDGDAQQSLINKALSAGKYVNEINQRIADKSLEFLNAMRRLEEYSAFVRRFLPHQFDECGREVYSRKVSVKGLTVGVAGLNSAWTCAGDEDDRNIWLGANWQFNEAHQKLDGCDVRIGLMHHPVDWLNSADRELSTRRIASDFEFWLHGHTHSSWVIPSQQNVIIAAGAVGAEASDEFGFNVVEVNFDEGDGFVDLFSKKAGASGWTIAPIENHAPRGRWRFLLPEKLKLTSRKPAEGPACSVPVEFSRPPVQQSGSIILKMLEKRLEDSLRTFSTQPSFWVAPTIAKRPEIDAEADQESVVDIADLLASSHSTIVCAPPQYGLTCLANFLIKEAWAKDGVAWIYLNAKVLKPYANSFKSAVQDQVDLFAVNADEVKCIVFDSFSSHDKDALKILRNLCETYPTARVICLCQIEGGRFENLELRSFPDSFKSILYLWALHREGVRGIVSVCNELSNVGDEDAVTTRLVSDLETLNLHRTPLNCITLLKVYEIDFDESPVNRCEIIKRVLFLLFSIDEIPTYKARPDLKDCEYVLGYFCERLIRNESYNFSRDEFVKQARRFCEERLIDLEIQVVFDVLYNNNIIVRQGNHFCFRFSYWILYFAAQRMHNDAAFAKYILDDTRYSAFPEILEFYTGIDRQRQDALEILIRDLRDSAAVVNQKCGLPKGINPYKFAKWEATDEVRARMCDEIASGVQCSNLPPAIKDEYADRAYDPARPYNQEIANLLSEQSFVKMVRMMRAGAKALRNSDYVEPAIKRELLQEIMNCWEEATGVLLVVLPVLARDGRAFYDGANFVLQGDFGSTYEEKVCRILSEIPRNVMTWCQDDLFSHKLGPLLFDQLKKASANEISKHELILMLIKQRPRGWREHIHGYVTSIERNSFYLHDVHRALRAQYQYGYASSTVLKDLERLIIICMVKHVKGIANPGQKAIQKFENQVDEQNKRGQLIPPREVR